MILGIDDAGRGPVIGPMILAGLLIDDLQEKNLKNKVKDSKLLSQSKRLLLKDFIKQNSLDSQIVRIFPEEIDRAIINGPNLNNLEAIKTAEIINHFNQKDKKIKVIVDCPSPNILSWKLQVLKHVEKKDNIELICEHKADFNYPAVSGASILAKLAREEEVDKIKRKFLKFGEMGSGYPSDKVTQTFLELNGEKLKDSGIFRKSWATWKLKFPNSEQLTLNL